MRPVWKPPKGRASLTLGNGPYQLVWLVGIVVVVTTAALLLSARGDSKVTVVARAIGSTAFPDYTEQQTTQAWTSSAHAAADVLQQHFPQTGWCGGDGWKDAYARLHADIVSGKRPPRYMTSVAHNNGVADRVTGLVTEFYLAMLSGRALTTVAEDELPGFEAACDMPYINWTHPFAYPGGVTDHVKLHSGGRSFPAQGPINSSMYHAHYVMNVVYQDAALMSLGQRNMSNFPEGNPNVPYVLSGSNRGQTYRMVSFSPYHKQQFLTYGLHPERAFMCGFFYLCAPNKAVQELYKLYWEAMGQANTLKIGINVRVGDHVFRGDTQLSAEAGARQLAAAEVYFQCADKVAQAFAVPGQRVIWYVISDSLALRKAAKEKYGDKVLTDVATKIIHPSCRTHNPEACQQSTMELSMQHSIGQMVTYSLADYHIYTTGSGFGRLGAWLSGKYANLFELDSNHPIILDKHCIPDKPTNPEISALSWATV